MKKVGKGVGSKFNGQDMPQFTNICTAGPRKIIRNQRYNKVGTCCPSDLFGC